MKIEKGGPDYCRFLVKDTQKLLEYVTYNSLGCFEVTFIIKVLYLDYQICTPFYACDIYGRGEVISLLSYFCLFIFKY